MLPLPNRMRAAFLLAIGKTGAEKLKRRMIKRSQALICVYHFVPSKAGGRRFKPCYPDLLVFHLVKIEN